MLSKKKKISTRVFKHYARDAHTHTHKHTHTHTHARTLYGMIGVKDNVA